MFWKTFFCGDRLKNFCEDLFFLESTCACVLGPWPWPRAFLSLASKVSVLGKAVLGLSLEPCVLDSTSLKKPKKKKKQTRKLAESKRYLVTLTCKGILFIFI